MRILAVLCPLILTGCGVAAKIDARTNYQQSLVKYRSCITAAVSPAACERERLIMDADERAFKTTAAAVDGGMTSVDATIRSR